MSDELEHLVDRALRALAGDRPVAPSPLRLLLRHYRLTGRADIEGALGPALARALDASARERGGVERTAWLVLFVEAATLSDDERVHEAIAELTADAVRGWAVEDAGQTVAARMRSIDACFQAADLRAGEEDTPSLIAQAIDALERVVGPQYRPGEGIGHLIGDPARIRGRLQDQVATASALLAAYTWTGRLPYSMLAEELMQFVRRTHWPVAAGSSGEFFVSSCEAVGVLCRLVALHANAEYRNMAVIAPDDYRDYRSEAERVLRSLSSESGTHALEVAAELGLAVSDYLTLANEL